MKPLRGSNRETPKGPNAKGKEQKRQKEVKKQGHVDDTGLGNSTQLKTVRKKKVGSHSKPSIIKGQENWKQISVSSLADLEKILDLSILATLVRKQTNKKEFQEHLNALKKRFLEHCSALKVPGYKQKQESAARLMEEMRKSEAEKQTLSSLEENLRAVVSALEKNEQETNVLEHQCSVLRSKVQDQEEEFDEVFQRKEAVVNIPPLQLAKGETTLEAKLRKAVPHSEAEIMARKLGEVLQNREGLDDAQELLSLAHKHVDETFNPGPGVIPHY